MTEILTYIATENDKGKRLDIFLQEKIEDFSRNKINNLVDKSLVKIDDKIATKSGYILKGRETITAEILENKPMETKAENIPLDIVYQDEYLAVINKPQGMVVHAGNGNYDKTLVNALLFHIKDLSGINGVLRPGIVHRLDKNTAGLMLVAKNDFAHANLAKQIENKTCKRQYVAILQGNVKEDSGTITTYISRHLKNRKIMTTSDEKNGKIAITEYKVLERFPNYSFVQFNLKTGRTHQIRVHAKEILRCPIANDTEYGGSVPRVLYKSDPKSLEQYLFAEKIEFTHPKTQEKMSFSAPLPDYFEAFLRRLRLTDK